ATASRPGGGEGREGGDRNLTRLATARTGLLLTPACVLLKTLRQLPFEQGGQSRLGDAYRPPDVDGGDTLLPGQNVRVLLANLPERRELANGKEGPLVRGILIQINHALSQGGGSGGEG